MVTAAQRHKVNSDPIADPHIVLLEFNEDGQTAIIRAAINTEDVVHNGETYTASGISIKLPSEQNNQVTATLSAANVDGILGRAIDNAKLRINVRVILIDSSIPDTAIIDTLDLLVAQSSTIAGDMIDMRLGPRATMQEPVPSRRTTRNSFPGVWAP